MTPNQNKKKTILAWDWVVHHWVKHRKGAETEICDSGPYNKAGLEKTYVNGRSSMAANI